MDQAKGQLPEDIDPPVVYDFDPQNLPVVEFTLGSATLSPVELRQFAEYDLAYRFTGVPGVAFLRSAGGQVREVQVRVNPLRLRAHGLTFPDLVNALDAANMQRSAGRVDLSSQERSGQVLSLFGSAAEIARLPIALPAGEQVALGEFAQVLDTHQEQRLIVRVNGEEAVKLSVFKSPDANATQAAHAIRERLAELRTDEAIPADVQIAITTDESGYIRSSIASAEHALALALALVALTVLIFLREWKFTLISLTVLPLGLCLTALLMQVFGMSLNLMSIGGLILGVTLMVDYGIVLLENVTRHWAAGAAMDTAVKDASGEVGGALLASLAVLFAAVIPFLFLGGTALLFFEEFILTIMFATAAGLLGAFTVIPALWPRICRFVSHAAIEEGEFMTKLTLQYRKLLQGCMRNGRWLLAVAVFGLVLVVWTVPRLGYLFLPEIDDGRVTITIEGEPGMLLTELQTHVARVEALALARPEVQLVDVSSGGRIGQSVQELPAFAEMLVELVPKASRTMDVTGWMADFDSKLAALDLTGVEVRVRKARIRAIRTFSGQASTGDFDVVVNIQGQDSATLVQLGDAVRDRLRSIPDLTDLASALVPNHPLITFRIDQSKAATYGISPAEAAVVVQTGIEGAVASRLLDSGFYHDIRVMSDRKTLHGHLSDLSSLPLKRLTNGDMLLLGQIADLELNEGLLTIDRVNQVTVNIVNGTVRGRTIGEVANDVRAALREFDLPTGYSFSYGGRMAVLDTGGNGLGWVTLLALALIVVVLAVQYESFVNPLLIVLILPMGAVGSVVLLWLTGTPLSATVFIGLLLLMGIAGNNAIVLVSYIEQLRRNGMRLDDAVVMGASARVRPKLMTALVAIAGMVPLAGGGQEAGEILQPLALAVIGGMPVSLAATLLLLPAMYRYAHARLGTNDLDTHKA